jgi:PAS domain S-box-containing protein
MNGDASANAGGGDAPGRGAGAVEARGEVPGWAGRRSRTIVAAYVAAGVAWILLSDVVLSRLGLDFGSWAMASLLKGLAFVAVTALVLHWRLRALLGDLQATRADRDAAQDRLRQAIVEAPIPAIIHAEDGSVLLVNRAWQESTGYRPEELRTVRDWLDRAYGRRRDQIEGIVQTLYRLDRRLDEGDFDVRVADGSTRTWSFSTGPVGRLPDGRRLVLSMALDVTERRRAEDALRASEERFRTLVEATPESIFIQAGGRFAYANPACVALLGARDAREILDRPVLERFHPADRAAIRARIARLNEAHEAVGAREETLLTLDGRSVDVEVTAAPLPHDGQGGALVFVRDITARKAAKRELVRSATRLRELSRRLLAVQEDERRRLARELHDEVGQRLTAILMAIAAARRRPEQQDARLDDAAAMLGDMVDLVRNLALDLRPSILDDLGLVAALRWYVGRFGERAAMEGTFLGRDVEAIRIAPEVATACFRAVQEALTNVARHARAGRFVVELEPGPGGALSLSIRDDGVGFDPAAAAGRPGAGMGLAGMRERVEQAGGRVAVVAAPGAGTEVRLTFPAPAAAPAPAGSGLP